MFIYIIRKQTVIKTYKNLYKFFYKLYITYNPFTNLCKSIHNSVTHSHELSSILLTIVKQYSFSCFCEVQTSHHEIKAAKTALNSMFGQFIAKPRLLLRWQPFLLRVSNDKMITSSPSQ